TLKNSSNCPLKIFSPVTLSGSGPGTATIAPVSATTDNSGVATFSASATVAGVYTFAGAANGFSKSLQVVFIPGAVYSGTSTLVASPTTVTADGLTTSDVLATLKDKYGNNVGAGKTLGLGYTAKNPSGTILPGADAISWSSNVSNSSGQVTFQVKRAAAGTIGTSVYTATDSVDYSPTVTIVQTATVVYTTTGVSVGTSTVVASPSSVQADGTSISTVTVTLKDQFGAPVSGKTVSLTSSRGVTDTITILSATT